MKAKNAIFIGIGFLLLLLAGAYVLGSGRPLPMPNYSGDANTFVWLKVIDMWLYTIYILLGLVIVALVGGIIWNYFKKNR